MFLRALAGPSRGLSLRTPLQQLPGLPIRLASTVPTAAATPPATPATRVAPAEARPRGALAHKRPPLTERQWPWYPVEPPRHPGQVEEERVIYARPTNSNGKLYWAMAILYGSGVVMYLVLPSVDEVKERGYDGDEGTVLGMPLGDVFYFVSGGAITAFSILAFFGLVYPSRLITRMSLVRSRPIGAPLSDATQCIRIQHLGHSMMWGKRSLPRDVPVKDVSVNVILGHPTLSGERQREPWLSVKIDSPRSKSRFSFDRYKYRLDFRNTPQLANAKGEVVLSIARIEDVFGPLEVGNPQPVKVQPKVQPRVQPKVEPVEQATPASPAEKK